MAELCAPERYGTLCAELPIAAPRQEEYQHSLERSSASR